MNVTPLKRDRKINCKRLFPTTREKKDKIKARNERSLHIWWAGREKIIPKLFHILYLCLLNFSNKSSDSSFYLKWHQTYLSKKIFISPRKILKSQNIYIYIYMKNLYYSRDHLSTGLRHWLYLGPHDRLIPGPCDRLTLDICDHLSSNPHDCLFPSPNDQLSLKGSKCKTIRNHMPNSKFTRKIYVYFLNIWVLCLRSERESHLKIINKRESWWMITF